MNLSKKTIKHILRILDNKCVKSPVETAVFQTVKSNSYQNIERNMEPSMLFMQYQMAIFIALNLTMLNPTNLLWQHLLQKFLLLHNLQICEVSYG